jgi:hypothetical protein
MVNTPAEDIFEFLNRLDIDATDILTKERFRSAIDSYLQAEWGSKASDSQIEALYPMANSKYFDLPLAGIREVTFMQRGREQTRFVIEGMKGLFGIEKTLAIFGARR